MTDYTSRSSAVLDAALVLEAVSIASERIDKRYAELREAAVQLEMKEKSFLGLKWSLSRVEAGRAVDKDMTMIAHRMASESRKDFLRNLSNLAAAAILTDGKLSITAQDFERFATSFDIALEKRRLARLTDTELADEQAAASASQD